MRIRRLFLATLFSAGAVAACSPPTEPLTTSAGLAFTPDPASFFLSVGESQTVTINAFPIGGVAGTVKWSSSDPSVVTVDSLVPLGGPATVRAVSIGSAALRATVSANAVQSTVNVPVRVRAGG